MENGENLDECLGVKPLTPQIAPVHIYDACAQSAHWCEAKMRMCIPSLLNVGLPTQLVCEC